MAQTPRRACSEPPKSNACRAPQLLAMQSFGVLPGVEDVAMTGRRRSISPDIPSPIRHQLAKASVGMKNIDGVLHKKSCIDAASPRGCCSPSLAARALESVDIDAHAGRKGIDEARPHCSGILPFDSPSFSTYLQNQCKDPLKDPQSGARRRSFHDFEKILEAERYAQLIGRPQTRSNKDLECFDCSLSPQSSPRKPPRGGVKSATPKDLARLRGKYPSSETSTNVGDDFSEYSSLAGSCVPSPRRASLSQSEGSNDVQLQLRIRTAIGGDENRGVRVPLGLHRLLASLLPRTTADSDEAPEHYDTILQAGLQALPKELRANARHCYQFTATPRHSNRGSL